MRNFNHRINRKVSFSKNDEIAQKSFSGNAVDLNAIKDVSAILEASNSSSKSPPSVLRKSMTANKNVISFSIPPSTEDAISSSLGIKSNDSSSKHNPWSVPGNESKTVEKVANVQTILSPSQHIRPSPNQNNIGLPPPAIPVRPTSTPNAAPQGALTKTQLQQKEAQLALQRAHHDLALAQEQAKKAALIHEQNKRAQEEEAQSAMALAKAQETARQAALIKEQSERALRAAQAGLVHPPPLQQNSSYGISTHPIAPQLSQTFSNASMTSSFSAGTAGNFSGPAYNQPAMYQPGNSVGMMRAGSGGSYTSMISTTMPPGNYPRPGLQAPLIPVNNSISNPPRPFTGSNDKTAPNNNDPYAVFRTVNVNEPSIFTSSMSGSYFLFIFIRYANAIGTQFLPI